MDKTTPPVQVADTSAPAPGADNKDAQPDISAEHGEANPQEGASANATNGPELHTTSEGIQQKDEASPPATNPEQPESAVDEHKDMMPKADSEDTSQAAQSAGNAASTDAAAPNGTPAGNKRASVGGSSKKKASAVPEHKSKKLNRKKSRPLTHLDAGPGQYFFARMKGHPPWPSIICDEEMLPHSLLSTRPVTAALADGNFRREEYADGGKRAYERTFPVMFLHTNEFAWIPNTELAPLDPSSEDVTSPSEKGKSKVLLAAYAKAAENNDLAAFKTMLLEHEKAIQEDQALQEEKAAKKAEKAKKAASRKSEAKSNDDDMDIDDEAGAEKPKAKKRKKVADESDADEKPSKTPKTATKLKLSTPKQPAESATKKKSQKPKSKTTKSGSDEDAQTPKVEETPLSPTQAREIMEKKVLYYRHKLQRGFLSRDAVPKAEEMGQMSEFLTELEGLPDLESSIIRATKIHKVLKQMIKLDNIPKEEEHNFKTRSSKLLSKWNDTLAKDAPADAAAGEKGVAAPDSRPDTQAQESAPEMNGDGAAKKEEPAEEKKVDESTTTADPPAVDEPKLGTDVEGKKEADEAELKQSDAMDIDPPKTEEQPKPDAPAVEQAPAEEYKPTAQESVATSA